MDQTFDLVQTTQPDEIYNLAAQSHVAVSFDLPEYTANANALGPLRLLEAIRLLNFQSKPSSIKLLHLNCTGLLQRRRKLKTHHSVHAVRMRLLNSMLIGLRSTIGKHTIFLRAMAYYSTMSPLRGETFVTRKSQLVCQKSKAEFRIAYILAILMLYAIGGTPP